MNLNKSNPTKDLFIPSTSGRKTIILSNFTKAELGVRMM